MKFAVIEEKNILSLSEFTLTDFSEQTHHRRLMT